MQDGQHGAVRGHVLQEYSFLTAACGTGSTDLCWGHVHQENSVYVGACRIGSVGVCWGHALQENIQYAAACTCGSVDVCRTVGSCAAGKGFPTAFCWTASVGMCHMQCLGHAAQARICHRAFKTCGHVIPHLNGVAHNSSCDSHSVASCTMQDRQCAG
jgi:hypothetical protein